MVISSPLKIIGSIEEGISGRDAPCSVELSVYQRILMKLRLSAGREKLYAKPPPPLASQLSLEFSLISTLLIKTKTGIGLP